MQYINNFMLKRIWSQIAAHISVVMVAKM